MTGKSTFHQIMMAVSAMLLVFVIGFAPAHAGGGSSKGGNNLKNVNSQSSMRPAVSRVWADTKANFTEAMTGYAVGKLSPKAGAALTVLNAAEAYSEDGMVGAISVGIEEGTVMAARTAGTLKGGKALGEIAAVATIGALSVVKSVAQEVVDHTKLGDSLANTIAERGWY